MKLGGPVTPRCASCAQSTPVSATQPCTMRTASVPSTLLWKLPPQRLNARASALSVCAVFSFRMRAAAAVAANTTSTPVGSKPSYCDSLRFRRELSSAPAASAATNSAPLQPPASSAAASAAGSSDEPMCGPGAIASQ